MLKPARRPISVEETVPPDFETWDTLDPQRPNERRREMTSRRSGVSTVGRFILLTPPHLAVNRDPAQVGWRPRSGEESRDSPGVVAKNERMLVGGTPALRAPLPTGPPPPPKPALG